MFLTLIIRRECHEEIIIYIFSFNLHFLRLVLAREILSKNKIKRISERENICRIIDIVNDIVESTLYFYYFIYLLLYLYVLFFRLFRSNIFECKSLFRECKC